MEIVARGVRNTVGFDWHPQTKELWFTDNGRDWAGDDGFEDELNRVPQGRPARFFGFPYCHANGMPDPDIKKPNPCAGVTLPAAHARAARGGARHALLHRQHVPGRLQEHGTSSRAAARGTAPRRSATTSCRRKVNGGKATITPFMTGFLDAKTDAVLGPARSTCCRCPTARCWSPTSRTARSTA